MQGNRADYALWGVAYLLPGLGRYPYHRRVGELRFGDGALYGKVYPADIHGAGGLNRVREDGAIFRDGGVGIGDGRTGRQAHHAYRALALQLGLPGAQGNRIAGEILLMDLGLVIGGLFGRKADVGVILCHGLKRRGILLG